jgi:serine/threonine protein kinase
MKLDGAHDLQQPASQQCDFSLNTDDSVVEARDSNTNALALRIAQSPELLNALSGLADSVSHYPAVSSVVSIDEVTSLHPNGASELTHVGESFLGRRMGHFEIISEIARGGMGVVFKAKHLKLDKIVAIKMILTGQQAGREEVRRFHIEAQAAANLEHPGIVPVYEIGEMQGTHFFAMAYIDGESLADRVKRGPISPRKAAAYLRKISEAIAYAHDRGVIHRDLKPANILLDRGDEPRVTDFGLARRTQGYASLTQIGVILGTPSFMPPEQAVGNVDSVGTLSDLYSLGAILYCMLTGVPPFQGKSSVDVLIQVVEHTLVPPRSINAEIPSDLELICLKCMEKNADNRYQSCRHLCDDLDNFLNGDAISLSSPKRSTRIGHLVQRNRDDVHWHSFSEISLWFAGIILCAEIGLQCIPPSSGFSPFVSVRLIQFATFGLVLIAYRKQLQIYNSAITQWISVSVCFIVAANAEVIASVYQHRQLYGNEVVHPYDCYPSLLILSGLFMATLGRQYWGMCYLFGLAFYALAITTPALVLWEPAIFGTAWFLTLVTISARLRRIGRDVTDT